MYSEPQNIVVSLNNSNSDCPIDFNEDGNPDFVFFAFDYTSERGIVFLPPSYLGSGYGGFIVEGTSTGSLPVPARLSCGYNIGYPLDSAGTFNWNFSLLPPVSYGLLASTGISSYGNFIGERGCIGVVFSIGLGPPFFGWVDFEGDVQDAARGIIHGWAYENQPLVPIAAGATPDGGCSCEAIPTLNEWGMIILVGLLAAGGLAYSRKEEELS